MTYDYPASDDEEYLMARREAREALRATQEALRAYEDMLKRPNYDSRDVVPDFHEFFRAYWATDIEYDDDDDEYADDEDLMSAGEGDEGLMVDDDEIDIGGVPEEVIARNLKTVAAGDGGDTGHEQLCAVCQDDLWQVEDRTVGVVDCGHRFHADCIGKWLHKKNVCPLCKAVAIHHHHYLQ